MFFQTCEPLRGPPSLVIQSPLTPIGVTFFLRADGGVSGVSGAVRPGTRPRRSPCYRRPGPCGFWAHSSSAGARGPSCSCPLLARSMLRQPGHHCCGVSAMGGSWLVRGSEFSSASYLSAGEYSPQRPVVRVRSSSRHRSRPARVPAVARRSPSVRGLGPWHRGRRAAVRRRCRGGWRFLPALVAGIGPVFRGHRLPPSWWWWP